MPDWLIYMLPSLTILLFVIAVGACIGSLVNVLVYRMPRGLDVVVPTSRCPKCDHKLTWRENIPILGWILLRGKCRFCKAKISAEYPIVEAVVAILFGAIWALWYMVPEDAVLGLGQIAPEWALNGAAMTWPATVVLLVLIGCLVAMTIIDARTSTIPLQLTWVPALTALVLHTGHAVWFYSTYGNPGYQLGLDGIWIVPNGGGMRWVTAPGEVWTIATGGLTGWKFIGMGIGGIVGLGVSNLMLRIGWLTQSFSDFDDWYAKHHQENTPQPQDAESGLGTAVAQDPDTAPPTPSEDQVAPESGMEEWLMYPHARREMVKELAFLCPPVLLGLIGAWGMVKFVGLQYGPWTTDPATGVMHAPVNAPLWLVVLGGVLMGYLIAGGVVWAVRIGGSIAFGKEAMGLGDVHMMAAVGACLGWIDPTIAFFMAAFVGVAYAGIALIFKDKLTKAMPYGPFLAIATLMVVLGKPLVEIGLGRIFGMDVPLDLP
jgi:leader peptidase (prepilin peptidase)/N-methyltransferase